jgi:hypothetical protein
MQAVTGATQDTAMESIVRLAEASGELHRLVTQFSNLLKAAERPANLAYSEMVPLQRRLEMVEEVSAAIRSLTRHGHIFRRSEARALYEDGLTMAELARVFGVSRQRVSILLRGEHEDLPTADPRRQAGPVRPPEAGRHTLASHAHREGR